VKIVLYQLPETLDTSDLSASRCGTIPADRAPQISIRTLVCINPQAWCQLKKVKTVQAGPKRTATHHQISRAVWDLFPALHDRWDSLVYRTVKEDGTEGDVCPLDDPDKWKRFRPEVGACYDITSDPHKPMEVWVIGVSSRGIWHFWEREVGSWLWRSGASLYPGEVPHYWRKVKETAPVIAQVVATQCLAYRQVTLREYGGVTPDGTGTYLPYLDSEEQNQLPLVMKETTDKEIEEAVGEVLKRLNRTLWIHRGLCPECVYYQLDEEQKCRECCKSFKGGAS